MKKYIKPTLDIENITMDSSIMVGSEIKGYYEGQPLKSKEFDFEEEAEEEEW